MCIVERINDFRDLPMDTGAIDDLLPTSSRSPSPGCWTPVATC